MDKKSKNQSQGMLSHFYNTFEKFPVLSWHCMPHGRPFGFIHLACHFNPIRIKVFGADWF